MNSFNLFLAFVLVLFCVVCGEANQKLPGRSTGQCPPGYNYELDEKSKTLTISFSGTGSFSHCRIDNYDKIKSVVLEEGFRTLNEGAFKGWTSLSSVSLPESVGTVGVDAFSNTALTTFNVTQGLTTLSSSAFTGCTKLAKFTIAENHSTYTVQNDVLFRMQNTVVMRYPPAKQGSSYTIPENVTTVFGSCFENCENLKQVILPENLKAIAEFGFRSSGIKSISIPAKVQQIFQGAFDNNANLEYVKYLGTKDPIVNTGKTVFGNCPLLSVICVESTYNGGQSFCGMPANDTCADPPSHSSSSEKGASSTKTTSSSSPVSSAVVHVPSIAFALLLVFLLF